MSERAPDLAFEMLVAETNASLPAERGKVNRALKQLREAEPDLTDEGLAIEIQLRCRLYRERWPEVSLTPPALAMHWARIPEETAQVDRARTKETPKTNQYAHPHDCSTCGGDRFVLVAVRPAKNPDYPGFEEYAPCPDCHTGEITFLKADGKWFRAPDPAAVRQMMRS